MTTIDTHMYSRHSGRCDSRSSRQVKYLNHKQDLERLNGLLERNTDRGTEALSPRSRRKGSTWGRGPSGVEFCDVGADPP